MKVPLHLLLEEVLEFPSQGLLLSAEPGHHGQPVVDLLAKVPRHHRRQFPDLVECAKDCRGHVVAHPLGVGRTAPARKPDHLVELAIALLEDRLAGADALK